MAACSVKARADAGTLISLSSRQVQLTRLKILIRRLHAGWFFYTVSPSAGLVERAKAGVEVGEVGDGAGLGDELLVEDAAEGDHGEAGVLDLAELHRHGILALAAEAEGIEAEVARRRALLRVLIELEADDAAGGAAMEKHVDVADEEEDLEPALRRDLRVRRGKVSAEQYAGQVLIIWRAVKRMANQREGLTALKLAAG